MCHGQSFRRQVRSTDAKQGNTELRILDFKTTWAELYLNNYFDFHVCLSFRRLPFAVRRPCVRKLISIPAVVQQNVTNKSCLVCVISEKYASWVTLRPQLDRCP